MSQPAPDRVAVSRAALDLLDDWGPGALSREIVAQSLGCARTELDELVESDDALLDMACDQIYAEIDMTPLDAPWPERLRAYSRSFRAALLRHPRAAITMATRPIVSVASMRVAERALGELLEVGFKPREANQVLLVVVSFVTGHVLTEIGERGDVINGPDPEAVARFREGLPPDELPLAAEVVSDVDREAEFELGLKLITDGLERRLLHA